MGRIVVNVILAGKEPVIKHEIQIDDSYKLKRNLQKDAGMDIKSRIEDYLEWKSDEERAMLDGSSLFELDRK